MGRQLNKLFFERRMWNNSWISFTLLQVLYSGWWNLQNIWESNRILRHHHRWLWSFGKLHVNIHSDQEGFQQQIFQSVDNAGLCRHQVTRGKIKLQYNAGLLFSYLSMKEISGYIRCIDLYYPEQNLMNLYNYLSPSMLHPLYKILQLVTVFITMILRYILILRRLSYQVIKEAEPVTSYIICIQPGQIYCCLLSLHCLPSRWNSTDSSQRTQKEAHSTLLLLYFWFVQCDQFASLILTKLS